MKTLPGIKPITRLAVVIGTIAVTAILVSCGSPVSAATAAKSRYAVVIGIEQYEHIDACSYTENDANDMKTLLAAKGWTVVSTLKSASATKKAIESAIKGLASYIGSNMNATVLVYYSGHGDVKNGTAYICPYATDFSKDISGNYIVDAQGYRISDASTMISASEITALLGSLTCGNKLLILDSCYSGGFVTSSSGSYDTSSQNFGYGTNESGIKEGDLLYALANASSLVDANLAATSDPDVLCISAAGSGEMSWGNGTLGNGVMSYYLIESASKGDANNDGYVSATEAFKYAKAQIKANWNDEYESTVEKKWDSSINDFDYTLYGKYKNECEKQPGTTIKSWSDICKCLGITSLPDFLPHISGGTGDLVLFDNN